ncbi:hypothetical protein Tco_1197333 [Tanacetum coccineum]
MVPQPSDPSDIVADEVVYKELGDSLVRAATTASSLEAEHDSGGGPRCQETMGDTIAQTRFENVSKLSNDSLLARDEESLGEDASKQGRRINDIDEDEDITLVNVQDDADNEMFDVGTVTGDEVFAEQEVAAKDVKLTVDEVTLAQALAALKSVKSKVKEDVIEEPSVPVSADSASTKVSAATTTTATIPTPRKGIVITKLGTPTTTISSQQSQDKDAQIRLDEETAKRLQAEFDEEERLAREKVEKEKEANIALTEEWDDIEAKIEADHELAQRLQAEEQEELSDAEKATLFQQLLEKRRKHFAAKRAEEQRNKETNHQHKLNKEKIIIDLVEGSSKRAGEELEQESTKKQKVDEDKKIHKEGKKSYYQIVRADGKSQMYRVFSQMLKSFTREDLEDLYKLVKAKYGSTRPVEDLDLLLWGDLKTMFEPHVEDQIWKNQQNYKVLD